MYIKSFNFNFYSYHFGLHIWGHPFATDMSIRLIISHWNLTFFHFLKSYVICMHARYVSQESDWNLSEWFKFRFLSITPSYTSPKCPKSLFHSGFRMVRCSRIISPDTSPSTSPIGWWVLDDGYWWMVGPLVRGMVRWYRNTSPSERPINSGIQSYLVRCWPVFRQNITNGRCTIPGDSR